MLRQIFFAALILAIGSTTVMACLCAYRPPSESFAEADDVFIGKVIRVDDSEETHTTFDVLHWLKGNRRQLVMVSGFPCDVWFSKGSTYIVYAREAHNRLIASSCAGTTVVNEPYDFNAPAIRVCDNYQSPFSYQRIAAITASSVALSLTLGVCVGAIKRRFRK